MSQIINYFAEGNTSKGFINLYHEGVFQNVKRLYVLKGSPATGKSTFMRSISLFLIDKGYDIIYLHSSLDHETIRGMIAPGIGVGFVEEDAIDTKVLNDSQIELQYLNFDEYYDGDKLNHYAEELISLQAGISQHFDHAYEQFALAKQTHDEWESIYINAMDFTTANEITDELISELFADPIQNEEHPTYVKIFFGAATPLGPINFIDNITANINNRYIIKGKPGSGKSTMMKKVIKAAQDRNLSIEVFPCAFDPTGIDMVIIPALSVAVFDGTSPHEINPTRENDQVIDMFELTIDHSVEIEKEVELKEIAAKYKNYIRNGTGYLMEAKRLYDVVKQCHATAMNYEAVNNLRTSVLNEIVS